LPLLTIAAGCNHKKAVQELLTTGFSCIVAIFPSEWHKECFFAIRCKKAGAICKCTSLFKRDE